VIPFPWLVVVETSSRLELFFPKCARRDILLTKRSWARVARRHSWAFNDSVDKLQDFTVNADAIEPRWNALSRQGTVPGRSFTMPWGLAWKCSAAGNGHRQRKPGRRRVILGARGSHDEERQCEACEVLRRAQFGQRDDLRWGFLRPRGRCRRRPNTSARQSRAGWHVWLAAYSGQCADAHNRKTDRYETLI